MNFFRKKTVVPNARREASLALLTLCAFFCVACGTQEQVTERWPNGAERVVEHHNRSGELVRREERHFNYLRQSSVDYRNGLPHGQYLSWRSDGTPEWSGEMVDGLREGRWNLWRDRNGALLQQGEYRQGQKEGEWLAWHRNGALRERSHWCGGNRCGLWESWDTDENLLTRSNCWSRDSVRLFQRFNREGRLELEYECHDSLRVGRWTRWDFLGNKMEERNYREDQLDGEQRTWFSSEKVRAIIGYKEGKRDGVQQQFSSDGDTVMNCLLSDGTGRCIRSCSRHQQWICADSSWNQGVLHGKIITWDLSARRDEELWEKGRLLQRSQYRVSPVISQGDTLSWNSSLAKEGGFKEGLQQGLWKQWSNQGLLLEESHYDRGNLLGEQLIYDSTGRLAQKRIHHGEHRGVTIETIPETSP